jgi:chromosome segregation ATPase
MLKVVISIAAALCLCACTSTRQVDRDVLEHQKQIDRLENELSNRDRAIDNAIRELESITARSSTMEGTIDDIIRLFDEYQRAVERMLYEYRGTESKTETTVQSIYNSINNSTDSDIINDIRFYMLCERHKVATVAGYTVIEH